MAGLVLPDQRHKKAGSSNPATCADAPVYRMRLPAQESSNTHPSTGQGAVNFGSLRFVPARPPLGPAEKFQSLAA